MEAALGRALSDKQALAVPLGVVVTALGLLVLWCMQIVVAAPYFEFKPDQFRVSSCLLSALSTLFSV